MSTSGRRHGPRPPESVAFVTHCFVLLLDSITFTFWCKRVLIFPYFYLRQVAKSRVWRNITERPEKYSTFISDVKQLDGLQCHSRSLSAVAQLNRLDTFLIVCSKRVTSTLHCFQYIRPRFIYNTDHAPLSQCSVQHIAWHCRSTVTD